MGDLRKSFVECNQWGLMEGLVAGGWLEFDRGVTGHGGVICRGWVGELGHENRFTRTA